LERGYYGAWLAICLMALGVFAWAMAVLLMVEGGVLGARTTGVAALLGVVGMFMILVTYMNACMRHLESKSHNP
jgi:hypothetical protein